MNEFIQVNSAELKGPTVCLGLSWALWGKKRQDDIVKGLQSGSQALLTAVFEGECQMRWGKEQREAGRGGTQFPQVHLTL